MKTTRIQSNLFDYHKETNSFTAEVSELGPFVLHRLWPDTNDHVGFIMVSSRTGAEAVFVLLMTKHDGGDDTTGWIFAPSLETITMHPGLEGARVEVFND